MDHTQVRDRFSDYWEKALPERERQEVAAHLASCAECRAEYAAFEKTMAPFGQLHKLTAPDLKHTVPELIRQRSRGRFFGGRGGARLPLEWISLGMLLFLSALYLFMKYLHPAVSLH